MSKKPYTFTTVGSVYEEATGAFLGRTKVRKHTVYPDGRHTIEVIEEATLENEAEVMKKIGEKFAKGVSELCDNHPGLFEKLKGA